MSLVPPSAAPASCVAVATDSGRSGLREERSRYSDADSKSALRMN